MLLFHHTSNRWLVYITVHTTCEMRLSNDRVGDGGQRKPSVASRSARSGWRSVVDPGGDFALSRTDCLLPFLWDPDTLRYPSSLWLPTGSPPCEDKETHRQTMYIYKYKQPAGHNGCIVLCGHVMKWAMSKLLAHYSWKQLSGGETELIPNLWQFACIAMLRPNPHPWALSVSSTWFYFGCIHQHTGFIWRKQYVSSCFDI